MIENKVEVSWSVESTQSLVAGSEDCDVRVEMLSVRSLSSQQQGELQSAQCHTMLQCYNVTIL